MPRPSETILVHLYRGEVSRSDTWRTRLDNTSNWALTTAAAVTSLSFTSPKASHTILVVGGFLIWTFLVVESRRYRYYDLWIRRVRLLEDGFLAAVLRDEPYDPDMLRELADLVTRPRLYVSFWDALGLRLRRIYAPILLVMTMAWIVKLGAHPTPARSVWEAIERAHIGPVHGLVTVIVLALGAVGCVAAYVRSFVRPLPSGELRAARGRRMALADVFRPGQSSRSAAHEGHPPI